VLSHVGAGGPSNALPPVPHAPLDHILVVFVPPAHTAPTLALGFLLAQMDAPECVALVTFEMGAGGAFRTTPFHASARTQTRAWLGKFVNEIGYRPEDVACFEDEFAARIHEEKTNVVTAIINDGLCAVARVGASADRECCV
jgi:hypothetical protein